MLTPQDAAQWMEGFERPWWFAGGWALELFVGRPMRTHGDLEIGIWRDDQAALRQHLAGWEWSTAISDGDSGRWVKWKAGERVELPHFQLKADRAGETAAELEFMLNDEEEGQFQFRRDPTITLPVEAAIGQSREGWPYLMPEVQLLYKAKHHRPKDETDFAVLIEVMSAQQRAWLKEALRRWKADDPWIAQL